MIDCFFSSVKSEHDYFAACLNSDIFLVKCCTLLIVLVATVESTEEISDAVDVAVATKGLIDC